MAIKIIVDSASDFTTVQAKMLEIEFLPLSVFVDDTEYLDGSNIDLDFLEKKIKQGSEVKTSQGSYKMFEESFEKYANSNDTVMYFSFSSKISGNYQHAKMVENDLKEKYPNFDLRVYDTRMVLTGLQEFIIEAKSLADKGAAAEMIEDLLEDYKKNMLLFATTQDLYHLVKGGRLSNAQAVIGNMLNVKPIIAMQDGELLSIGKARGIKRFYKYIFQDIKKSLPKNTDFTGMKFGISHFNNMEAVLILKTMAEKQLGNVEFIVNDMSVIVASHVGPGGIACFFKKPNLK